jgi:hypothetical protein
MSSNVGTSWAIYGVLKAVLLLLVRASVKGVPRHSVGFSAATIVDRMTADT